MKHKLRIGEFAKLKNITTETLRHYDRVGLLKPVEVDEETGYRYYSVFQSEKMATIIELKALGYSIDEMKSFLDDRSLNTTYDLLIRRQKLVKEKIAALENIERSLDRKINRLAELMDFEDDNSYIIKDEPACQVVFMDAVIKSDVSFEWLASDMENRIVDIHPVIGSDAYAILVSKEAFERGELYGESNVIYFIEDTEQIEKKLLKELPKRKLACFFVRSPKENMKETIFLILETLKRDGHKIVGSVVIRFRITTMTTQVPTEQLYEFQVEIE